MGVVVHICNPSIQRLRQEDWEFKASPGYIERSCLKQSNKILKEKGVSLYQILKHLHGYNN
jgi:hypothetical protein